MAKAPLALSIGLVLLGGCDQSPSHVAEPAITPHHVVTSRPAPWTPEPVVQTTPPRQSDTSRPPTTDTADRRTPTGQAPRSRQSMPGEAAIIAMTEGQNSTSQERKPLDSQQTPQAEPRSEIAPTAVTPPRPLHAAWQEASSYNSHYKSEKDQRFNAIVQAVETYIPAEGAEPGLALRVTIDGNEKLVHTAPLRFLRERNVRFNYQDSLIIHASTATINGQPTLLARRITRGENLTINFRDPETGRPFWNSTDQE